MSQQHPQQEPAYGTFSATSDPEAPPSPSTHKLIKQDDPLLPPRIKITKSQSSFLLSDPTEGPLTPHLNQALFKASLCLEDARDKTACLFREDMESMQWYHLRTTDAYQGVTLCVCFLYLGTCLLENPAFGHQGGGASSLSSISSFLVRLLSLACIVFFLGDVYIQGRSIGWRKAFRYKWTRAFIFLLLLDAAGLLLRPSPSIYIHTRLWHVTGAIRCFPLVYYTRKARDALFNYTRILPSVLLWIATEFFIILVFSCLAVIFYAHVDEAGISGSDAFVDLPHAFLSLYSLALTVNDPDVYLPYYKLHAANSILFVSFLVLNFFIIHNIILSRVFQIYSEKLKEVAQGRKVKQQHALLLAFQALVEVEEEEEREEMGEGEGEAHTYTHTHKHTKGKKKKVPRELVAHLLRRLKPRYSEGKIQMILQHHHHHGQGGHTQTHTQKEARATVVSFADDTSGEAADVHTDRHKDMEGAYNYPQFSALFLSMLEEGIHEVRASPSSSPYTGTHTQALLDAVVVTKCVLIVWGILDFDTYFYSPYFWALMCLCRCVLMGDLWWRVNKWGQAYLGGGGVWKAFWRKPLHRVRFFAVLLAMGSFASLCIRLRDDRLENVTLANAAQSTSKTLASVLLLLSGVCDLIGTLAPRIPEYSALFKAANDLFFPAFLGQATVVFTLMHIFCYGGMYLFGGRVSPDLALWEEYSFPQNLYWLNNFNSYREGMTTLFFLLVVNNWNIISSTFVAVMGGQWGYYLYFMSFQVLVVTVALSCVTSFFIGHLSVVMEGELEWHRQQKEHHHKKKHGEGAGEGGGGREKGHQIADDKNPAPTSSPHSPPRERRFRMERRVSSGYLLLKSATIKSGAVISAVAYCSILEALLAQEIVLPPCTAGDGDGDGATAAAAAYCFVKEKVLSPSGAEVVLKSTTFASLMRGGEKKEDEVETRIETLAGDVFMKAALAREQQGAGGEEGGGGGGLVSLSIEDSMPHPNDAAAAGGATLSLTLYFLFLSTTAEGEGSAEPPLAFCVLQENM